MPSGIKVYLPDGCHSTWGISFPKVCIISQFRPPHRPRSARVQIAFHSIPRSRRGTVNNLAAVTEKVIVPRGCNRFSDACNLPQFARHVSPSSKAHRTERGPETIHYTDSFRYSLSGMPSRYASRSRWTKANRPLSRPIVDEARPAIARNKLQWCDDMKWRQLF